jgi:hypothetical protein
MAQQSKPIEQIVPCSESPATKKERQTPSLAAAFFFPPARSTDESKFGHIAAMHNAKYSRVSAVSQEIDIDQELSLGSQMTKSLR